MRGIRKLAIACTGYCAAVFMSHYVMSRTQFSAAMALCVVIALSALLAEGNMRKRIIIFAVAAAAGFAHYELNCWQTIDKCEGFLGEKVQLSARVTDYPDRRSNVTLIYVRVTDARYPNVKALMFDYSDGASDLRPGDEISLTAKLTSATERYGEDTDSNISKGIYLCGSVSGEIERTGRWSGAFLYFPKYIGNALHTQIGRLFPDDVSHFMKALLAGYKGDYYNDDKLYSAMNIAGLAHVVAVSGMHVAFLIGVLQSVLGKTRRSGIMCIALVWLFVIMVGSPPSAVRAGIMISMVLLAPIAGRINDRATMLSFALALILLANPFAAGSVALQLSFGAVAGMFLFAQPLYVKMSEKLSFPRPLERVGSYITATLSSSLAVTVFTVPLVAVHFGYVTLLAPIMNILCLWAISILFTGGFLVCAIGLISAPAAMLPAEVLAYLVRYIAVVVEYTAKLPFAAVYTENGYVLAWLIVSYVMFVVCAAVRRKRKLTLLAPTAACLVLLALVFVRTDTDMRADTGTISVMSVGNGQCIAVTQRDSCVVIDCGSHGVITNAGSMLSSYLHSMGHNDIDYLVLTHLHTDHATGAARLMDLMRVKILVLPDNAADTSADGMLEKLLAAADENGTQVVYITQDSKLTAGEIELDIFESSERGKRNDSGIMLTVSIGEYDMLVTGDVEMSVERELVSKHELSGTELLIVPHHGSKYSCSEELLNAVSPDTAVVSTGYNNYGHPSDETLERLDRHGIETLRTDELGRIIIHITAGD